MRPPFPDDAPLGERLVRRARAIGLEAGAFAALTLLAPLLLALAVAVDAVRWVLLRRPWMAVRMVALAWWFLQGELRGLGGLLWAWVASAGRDTPRHRATVYAVRQRWCARHVEGVRVLFGLGLEVEGLEAAGPGPVLLLFRHASVVDNALPDALVGRAHGMGLRFALKREMQVLPTIDIGGRWVPTAFLLRGAADTAADVAAVRRLADGLGAGEGVMLYPEGTRYTPAKLARAQMRIAERRPELAPLAARLRYVMPPRLGGPVALLDAMRGTDVVVCAHTGLEEFGSLRAIWSGRLVGTTVKVRFRRFAATEVPHGEDALVGWLYARWHEVDDWVAEQAAY